MTVLKDAQDKGYAEKDPTADIEGHDPCRKIAILTSLGMQDSRLILKIFTVKGITKITRRLILNMQKAMRQIDQTSCIQAEKSAAAIHVWLHLI